MKSASLTSAQEANINQLINFQIEIGPDGIDPDGTYTATFQLNNDFRSGELFVNGAATAVGQLTEFQLNERIVLFTDH